MHFYLPDVGRISRYVLKASDADSKLRSELNWLLADDQAQLELLRQIRKEALRPVIRYKDLISALQGMADRSMLTTAMPNPNMQGLRDAVEADEQRLAELEDLFSWIDADGDGKLAFSELEAAAKALGGSPTSAVDELLARIKDGSRAQPLSVDLATFVNIMTAKVRRCYSLLSCACGRCGDLDNSAHVCACTPGCE